MLETPRYGTLLSVLALLLICDTASRAAGFSFTTPPPRTRKMTEPLDTPIVQTINQNIFDGRLKLRVRNFVKIPDFKGVGSKIVGMTNFKSGLYVTTSTSGAFIYNVNIPTRTVNLWFRLGDRVKFETGGEREVNCDNTQHGGLRGVAFPPDFLKTGLFYTSYVETPPKVRSPGLYLTTPVNASKAADSVVVEWRYDFAKKDVIFGSYRVVLRVAIKVFDHPIKQMDFKGPHLLISHGDGSVQSGINGGGMNNDGLGKILRIDPRKQPDGAPFGVPKDNPYIGNPNYPDAVYAVGFRNPHTICVSRDDGTIYSTDAGRDNAEEINIVAPGGNYGWPEREGTFVHLKKPDVGTGEGFDYLHPDDAKFGYTYPAAQFGHRAQRGAIFQSQAIAGGCPIENGSPLRGTFWYTNFPNGQMYYSWAGALKQAVTEGSPGKLRTAPVYRASIVYERPGKPPLNVTSFVGVVRADGYPTANRADVRIGRGPARQMFVSSKASGSIYVVANSDPDARR